MSDLPTLSGEHLFIDNNSMNTLEFYAAANSHLDLVKKYNNDLATFRIWDYTLHTHDPITRQAEFFKDIANTLLTISSNQEGTVDSKVNDILADKLDAILDEDEEFVRTNANELETKVNSETGLTEALVLNTNDKSKRYVEIEKNVMDDIKHITESVDSEWGTMFMIEEIVLYWMEKYKTSHVKVKEKFKELHYQLNPDHNIFQDYSDSIGYLARIEESLDRSSIPLNDIKLEKFDDVLPNVYNSIIEDKIDIPTKDLVYEMTKKTETLYRENIKNVVVANTSNDVAHGENLVGDKKHWDRIKHLVEEFSSIIQTNLGLLHDIIEFTRMSEDFNKQKTMKLKNSISVEKLNVNVDLLQNKIQKIQKNTTNAQVLSAV